MRIALQLVVVPVLGCAVAACGSVEPPPSDTGTWSIAQTTNNGAVLGVWGSGPTDLWAVGGDADRALVLHGDGTAWSRIDVAGSALLFSVYGFSASDVYAVGEKGLVLHFDGTSWTTVQTNTTLSLFGLWGASGDDVWIVGGDRAGAPGTAIVLRGSHGSFAPVALPTGLAPSVLFKAHGFAANDVMLVGSAGTVLRWNGTAWRQDVVPTSEPLLATWGRDDNDVYAVGGSDLGEIVHFDGKQWTQAAALQTGQGLTGVFTSPDGVTDAVGESYIFELARDGSLTVPALPAIDPTIALHGVWGDGAGTTYVVGGDLYAYPQSMTGVILSRR